jgi:hypothetical protein
MHKKSSRQRLIPQLETTSMYWVKVMVFNTTFNNISVIIPPLPEGGGGILFYISVGRS